MSRVIAALLRLAHLSRSTIRRSPVDLSAVARAVAEELNAAEPARTVVWRIAPDLQASADPDLIEIVMNNLLRNAWKYTSKRRSARIEFGANQEHGKQVFFVRDDGAGFDMAHASQLFGPFQRLHAQSEFEGLGIGLAIVQRIVKLHEGRIWAEGKVEKGATFFFTLS